MVGSEPHYTRRRAGSQSSDEKRSRKRARTEKSLSTQVTAADFRRVHLIRRTAEISELSPSPSRFHKLEDPPSTFQCMFCPKRSTCAYNLRVHLRFHADERPFVRTICGKDFARQQDRKRHEALHSVEQKYVCKGDLKQGERWGCGRRFAAADALGRHFRSEAGRICTKLMFDEEAIEWQRQWQYQQQEQQTQTQNMVQNIQHQQARQDLAQQEPDYDQEPASREHSGTGSELSYYSPTQDDLK